MDRGVVRRDPEGNPGVMGGLRPGRTSSQEWNREMLSGESSWEAEGRRGRIGLLDDVGTKGTSSMGDRVGACPSEESVMSRKCCPTALRLSESGVVLNSDLCGPKERELVGSSLLSGEFRNGLACLIDTASGLDPPRIPTSCVRQRTALRMPQISGLTRLDRQSLIPRFLSLQVERFDLDHHRLL